jgi:hypothetical protein
VIGSFSQVSTQSLLQNSLRVETVEAKVQPVPCRIHCPFRFVTPFPFRKFHRCDCLGRPAFFSVRSRFKAGGQQAGKVFMLSRLLLRKNQDFGTQDIFLFCAISLSIPVKSRKYFDFLPFYFSFFLTVVFDEAGQRLLCHTLNAIPIAPLHRHDGLDRPRLEQPHRVRFCKQVTLGV